ncbi:MAG: aspartate--tRNA(Asn) ligase [Candidatus Altiarchaeales archaeon IMC4]|nr:MAG: aspartate--tRNA(Asn) ligase [Candidatus Altiarchaeales archaeon IMC4]
MRTHYTNQITPADAGKDVVVCGWVHEVRDMGKLMFVLLRDRSGIIQITAKSGVTAEPVMAALHGIPKESVLRVSGSVLACKPAPGGVEVSPKSVEVLSVSKSPLPMDVTGKVKAEIDTRLDNRFMDLRKPEVAAIFKLRSRIVSAGIKYLENSGFIEVHTPKIIASASEGGTELFPIAYFDKEAFLAQSPQLYKQTMMSAGFDRVYEIARYFRAEEHDTVRHLNEIMAFDIEMSFIKDEADIMDVLEGLSLAVIKSAAESEEIKFLKKEIEVPKKVDRLRYDDVLDMIAGQGKKIEWGHDIDTEGEKVLGRIMAKEGKDIYFITKYPLNIKPFYTMPDTNKKYARAFDLEHTGDEISSGGQRIHDHAFLVKRLKHWNLKPENFEFYLKAFEYGMPPHGGFGLGIERILMKILNTQIREVVLFPRDRYRLTP